MQRIPIYLATLSLLSSGLPLVKNTALGVSALGLNDELTVVEASGLEANVRDSVVGPADFDLKQGSMTMNLSYSGGQGRKFEKLYFASFNYEEGITEAQADVLAMTLGENVANDRAWAKQWREYSFKSNVSTNTGLTWAISTNTVKTQLELNRSDILYYALLLTNPNDESVEPLWVRGKWDYRTCAHSTTVENGETMQCTVREDWRTGKLIFLPTGAYEAEEGILTWEEELLQMGEAHLEAAKLAIEAQEQRLKDGQEVSEAQITSLRSTLATGVAKVEKMGLQEELAEQIAGLEARIEALMPKKPEGEGSEEDDADKTGSDEDKVGSDDQTGEGDESGGKAEVGNGGGEKKPDGGSGTTVDNATVDNATADNATMSQLGNMINAGQPTDLKVPVEWSNTEVLVAAGSDEADNGAEFAGNQLMNDDDAKDTAAIEVPNLGGEVESAAETSWVERYFWAILLIILGVVGTGVWWIRRAFGRGHDD